MLLFQLALRYTKSQLLKPAYWLAILSFSLAISLLVVSLLVMSAYEKTFEKSITQFLGQVQISYLSPKASSSKILNYLRAENIPVLAVSSFLHQEALIVNKGRVRGILLEGLPLFEKKPSQIFLKKSLPVRSRLKIEPGRYGAYVPTLLIKDLSLKLGDSFSVVVAQSVGQGSFNRKVLKFYVAGILDFGRADYNRRYLLTSFLALQKPLGLAANQFSGLRLWFSKKVKTQDLAFRLQEQFQNSIVSRHWSQWAGSLLEAIGSQKKMIFFVLLIILIIAAFNIMSSLFILVVQKTKELSILRVSGLGARAVYIIFILQALFTGLLSIIVGLAMGYLWAYLFLLIQSHYFSILSQIYKLNHLKLGLPMMDMLVIIIVVISLVLLTAIVPIYRAGKNSLLEGLSHEF